MSEPKEIIIENDLKEAMKQKNEIKLSVLRMVKAAMMNLKIEKKVEKLDDADVLRVLAKEIKQHKDSIEGFTKGNRDDLVAKEKQELGILEAYMPKQMAPEELLVIVRQAIKDIGAAGQADMGKVIKAVMEQTKGAAEGKTISQLVGQELTKK